MIVAACDMSVLEFLNAWFGWILFATVIIVANVCDRSRK